MSYSGFARRPVIRDWPGDRIRQSLPEEKQMFAQAVTPVS
jgi:hypothetical protein